MDNCIDILVIGGGVNGTGIARDAAGRGLSVLLCEKDDLAGHTSSASTKLIHGGLRYLEHYEFRLVRASLIEREVLLRAAPHIIWPMRFVLPYHRGLRPAWLLRLGLFLYDHLGGRKLLPPTRKVNFSGTKHAEVLASEMTFGFEYSDCWVNDARLVALNAVHASQLGADIRTHTACTKLKCVQSVWQATLQDEDGNVTNVTAKTVVNAAGPWVDEVHRIADPEDTERNLRLVKGSHIVTRRLFDGDGAYIFQNADGRIIFAIPYEDAFTLIGTTDMPYELSNEPVEISEAEIAYLRKSASAYLRVAIMQADIVWSYSGVRPLFDDKSDDASDVTRDYRLKIEASDGAAPILSIYGGKITTFRKLSEQAVNALEPHLDTPKPGPWTRESYMPGGNIEGAEFDTFVAASQKQWSRMPAQLIYRLARAYGTRISNILQDCENIECLGQDFGCGLYEREVRYLVAEEFARTVDDILWRRTKIGLHMKEAQRTALSLWFKQNYR